MKLYYLKPGNCIAFGQAFKVPTVMYLDMPDPRPLSNNVDLTKVWFEDETQMQVQQVPTNDVSTMMQQQASQGMIGAPQQLPTNSTGIQVAGNIQSTM